jgi:anthranilate phosphoribosyltransferase
VTPEKVEECLEKIGIGFLFAASLHGAMKYAIGPRKQIGIRTIFNILGPLTNPAGATAQVLGVYSGELLEPLANVLKNLGARRAWIVHGDDGVDEISITSSTRVAELKDGTVKTYTIRPEDFELKCGTMADIRGGNARQNAEIVRQVLAGQKGPRRDMVVLNAGAGLHVGEKVKDIRDGVRAAQEAIDTGRAAERLEQLVRMTNE